MIVDLGTHSYFFQSARVGQNFSLQLHRVVDRLTRNIYILLIFFYFTLNKSLIFPC